eukprot:jgi/Ulvmu1/10380/UM061_0064.1
MSDKPKPRNGGTKQMKVMLAGGLAGAFSKTCTAPLGRMTILFQLGALKGHSTVWGATKHVVQSQGFLSLWRGHTATLLHRIPYSSVNFAVFEHTKAVLAPALKSRAEGGSYGTESARYLIAGAAGGSTGCVVAYPLDLVKTKMAGNLTKEVPRSGAMLSCVFSIMQQAGVQGLYKGIGATLMQVTPTLAINFTAYELTKGYIASVLMPERCPSQQAPPAAGTPPHGGAAAADAADAAGGVGSCCTARETGDVQSCEADRIRGGAGQGVREGAAAAELPAALHVLGAPPVVAIAASRQEEGRRRAGAPPGAALGASPRAGDVSADAISQRALISLIAGTVSGVVSSTTTFPLDVVRRRVQFTPDITYSQVVRAIYADGGVRAFYRGLMPEYMKVIPGVSIAFCAYEVLKAVLDV